MTGYDAGAWWVTLISLDLYYFRYQYFKNHSLDGLVLTYQTNCLLYFPYRHGHINFKLKKILSFFGLKTSTDLQVSQETL